MLIVVYVLSSLVLTVLMIFQLFDKAEDFSLQVAKARAGLPQTIRDEHTGYQVVGEPGMC